MWLRTYFQTTWCSWGDPPKECTHAGAPSGEKRAAQEEIIEEFLDGRLVARLLQGWLGSCSKMKSAKLGKKIFKTPKWTDKMARTKIWKDKKDPEQKSWKMPKKDLDK